MRRHYRPELEALESRFLLSGITVIQSRYGISITGDSNNNYLTIDRITDTTARLSGDRFNGSATYYDFNPNQSVSIDLGAGNDTLLVQGASVSAPLRFGTLSILGNDGMDRVTIKYTYVANLLTVSMGGGPSTSDEEFAKLNDSDMGGFNFRTDRKATLDRRSDGVQGHDNLYVNNCTVRGDMNLTGGDAKNEFYVDSTVIKGKLTIPTMGNESNNTGSWTDYFAIASCTVTGAISVNMGEGWGRVSLNTSTSDSISIVTGSSPNDEIWLFGMRARTLRADGGAGNQDQILGKGNIFTDGVTLLNIEVNNLVWSKK